MATRSDISLISRRAGFTPRRGELAAAVAQGADRLVAELLFPTSADRGAAATPPPTLEEPASLVRELAKSADPATRKAAQKRASKQSLELIAWWIRRMVATDHPFLEKMTFFWHGHFATSVQKVRSPALMLAQQDIFRSSGLGPFPALMLAVAHDPAMLRWLDAGTSSKGHANENFAREMFELFVLGHGNYTEEDVRQAARAFTGWRWRPATGFRVVARQHDDRDKTVLGHTGDLSGDDIIRIATATPASQRWVVSRIVSRYVSHAAPTDKVVTDLISDLKMTPSTALSDVFRAVLLSPALTTPAVRTGLIKQPVEWVVGAQRAAGVTLPDRVVLATLNSLGQVPFAPASVGGWPEGFAWLSTSATAARVTFAREVAARADLSVLADESVAARVDAAAEVLAVDGWSSTTRTALAAARGDPARLFTLALLSPEYQLA